MRLNKSGFFSLTLLLVIWVVLVILFGMFTHFSLAGLCLLVQTTCILLYEEMKIRYPEKSAICLLLAFLALVVAVVSLINVWYLEDIETWFKVYVFLFFLLVVYVCIKMLWETIRKFSAR